MTSQPDRSRPARWLAWCRRGTAIAALAALAGCDNNLEANRNKFRLKEIEKFEKELADSGGGMSAFILHQNIIDRCQQLLNSKKLGSEDRAALVARYVDSSLVLSENGDRTASENLTQFCRNLMNDSDPTVREACELAMLEAEAQNLFESQRVRNHVDELALLGARNDLGEKGEKFGELTAKFQSLWRDYEENGTDHAEELGNIIEELGKLIGSIPQWVGEPKEVEVRYNQLASHFRENVLPKTADFSVLFRDAEKLAADASSSPRVAQRMSNIADRMAVVNRVADAAKFGELTVQQFAGSTDAEIVAIRERLSDQNVVRNSGLEQLIHDWSKNPSLVTVENLEALQAALAKLKSADAFSPYAQERVTTVIHVVESANNADAIQKATAIVTEELGAVPEYGDALTQVAQRAEKRIAWIGQKFELPQAEPEANPVTASDFAGDWLLVIFWSAKDRNSIAALDKFETFSNAEAFEELNPRRLAINVDDDLAAAKETAASLPYTWPVLVPKEAENGKNPYAVQYGIDDTPYCILVNKEGIVEYVAMTAVEALARLMAKK